MKMKKECKKITDLPDEIIALILDKIVYNDIISFGKTCKQFHNVVSSDQSLWKTKCLEVLPHRILKSVEKHCNGNWFKQIKDFIELKKNTISELRSLSSKLFWRKLFWKKNSLTLDVIVKRFKLATKDELSHYYAIHVLEQILEIRNCNENICEKSYTLTEQRNAEIVRRYLLHSFLRIKWAKLQTAQKFHNGIHVHPEVVYIFYLLYTYLLTNQVPRDSLITETSATVRMRRDACAILAHLFFDAPTDTTSHALSCVKRSLV